MRPVFPMTQPRTPLTAPALNKAALADMLAYELRLSHRDAADMVDRFFDVITARLSRGESVKLASFGTFTVHRKKARPGRNPRTGVSVQIDSRQVVKFSTGPTLKRRLAEARSTPWDLQDHGFAVIAPQETESPALAPVT
jgi:integration host factor subunit alpha